VFGRPELTKMAVFLALFSGKPYFKVSFSSYMGQRLKDVSPNSVDVIIFFGLLFGGRGVCALILLYYIYIYLFIYLFISFIYILLYYRSLGPGTCS